MSDVCGRSLSDTSDESMGRLLRDEADQVEFDPDLMLDRLHAQMSPPHRARRVTRLMVPMTAVAAVAAVIVTISGGWSPRSAALPPAPPASTSIEPDADDAHQSGELSFTRADGGRDLSLSNDRDWVVVGNDSLHPTDIVRAEVQEQLLGVVDSGAPTVASEPSPFSLVYSHGQPPATSGVANRWLTAISEEAGARSQIDVRVQPAINRGMLTIYVGIQDATSTVQVLVDQEPLLTGELTPSGNSGLELSVDLSAYSEGKQVIVRLQAGRNGSVSVAGATLSS